MKRVILIVMDSAGIGELPDAGDYGDKGSNTIGNIKNAIKNFDLPNLRKLGLGNIDGFDAFENESPLIGCFGKMKEKSPGKDTTTGHWEIAGLLLDKPFPTYSGGFPPKLIKIFEREISRKTLGNYAASGTIIINDLGDEHVKTGYPIVYTSADSVFQIAAHEDIIPVNELYGICRKARMILKGPHAVARVIARPFKGESGKYTRTGNRHDFSIDPFGKTMLDIAAGSGLEVRGVGKIKDIFNGKGITKSVHSDGNNDGVEKTIDYLKDEYEGILFTNLVDFDMLYGHRNDTAGYAGALTDFDNRIPEIVSLLKDDDILIITADHGCDPTTVSTDHSREYVPLLVYGNKLKKGVNLGTRDTFSDIAATVCEYFGLTPTGNGRSFLSFVK